MSLNLATKSDFVGYYQIQFSTISDDFTSYYDQTEKQVMIDLFGKDMYNDMLANPNEPKYVDLIANYDLSDIMRNFFYYYYLRDRESYSTTLGEFEAQAENATRAKLSRNSKVSRAYNQGYKLYYEAATFVSDNKALYDKYTETLIIYRVNAFGIVSNPAAIGDIPYDHSDNFIRGCRG